MKEWSDRGGWRAPENLFPPRPCDSGATVAPDGDDGVEGAGKRRIHAVASLACRTCARVGRYARGRTE